MEDKDNGDVQMDKSGSVILAEDLTGLLKQIIIEVQAIKDSMVLKEEYYPLIDRVEKRTDSLESNFVQVQESIDHQRHILTDIAKDTRHFQVEFGERITAIEKKQQLKPEHTVRRLIIMVTTIITKLGSILTNLRRK